VFVSLYLQLSNKVKTPTSLLILRGTSTILVLLAKKLL